MGALAEKKASTPTPSGSAAKIPAMLQMGKADPTPAAQPNLSTAIGQLKSGDRLGASDTMRSTVGLPAISRPPMPANPTLQDAIARMKAGDKAGGEEIMRKIVGMKKGGKVSSSPKSSKVPSASKRADGIAQKGKTKGRMI
jgi:hypothetical protein